MVLCGGSPDSSIMWACCLLKAFQTPIEYLMERSPALRLMHRLNAESAKLVQLANTSDPPKKLRVHFTMPSPYIRPGITKADANSLILHRLNEALNAASTRSVVAKEVIARRTQGSSTILQKLSLVNVRDIHSVAVGFRGGVWLASDAPMLP